jgi:hypothetical protein
MSCSARYDIGLFSTDVHILGYDCTAPWVFPAILVATFCLKLYQNYIWGRMGQAQRLALQYEKRKRGPHIWSLVVLEAISTTLGIVSIVLILGTNMWVLLVILIGNLVGVHRTYSNMTKDSHSTAHDLVEMLRKHQHRPNELTAKFVTLLQEVLKRPPKVEQETYTENNLLLF